MRISTRPIFLMFGLLLLASCDRSGPRWSYVCDEATAGDVEKQCRAELTSEEHVLTLKREGDGWRMVVVRKGPRYVRGELTVAPTQGDPITLTAKRKDGTCWVDQCTFVMPQETVDALAKAKNFSVTLKTVAISNQSVRHTDHDGEFVTKGLNKVLRKLKP